MLAVFSGFSLLSFYSLKYVWIRAQETSSIRRIRYIDENKEKTHNINTRKKTKGE